MAQFRYEKNLPHQMAAVQSVLMAFNHALPAQTDSGENPYLQFHGDRWQQNIRDIQKQNHINAQTDQRPVLDIAMETGTGKTYTYTQTLYELHKQLGLYKFVIAVPTLSIKAGTEQFLKSEALRQHFRLDFDGHYGNAEIELYVVQRQQNKKNKNQTMPSEIVRFVEADNREKIHVLLLNMGMINSKTMKGEDKNNDGSLLLKDLYHKPIEAIASVKPILIIDEPHRFKADQKTWKSLMAFAPQFVLRYGATFNEQYYNLIYRLTAMEAFNQDLVKGVRAFIEQVEGDSQARIKFVEKISDYEAKFELIQNKHKQLFTLAIGESLQKIHHAVDDLVLNKIHRKKSVVVFNDAIELALGESINPYSYSNQMTDRMMRQAVREHFKLERELFNRPDKIKPLTLFFIDDIAGYRDENNDSGSLKKRFEACVKAEAQKALETAEAGTAFYHSLQTVLNNVSATHGGYFAKDNSVDDETIAQEINEILHDKQSLLALDNPRRFIFSKWTLREGWDNPNVFGICKLRSSGSETSKLQEVGRGLRLPVNEFMARVKDGHFMLNYFVDSSETDFVQKLTEEVNQSGIQERFFEQFSDELFHQIQQAYPHVKKRALGNEFYEKGWIDDNDQFIQDGLLQVKEAYPLAFTANQLKAGKIAVSGQEKHKVKMRIGKYEELKALWEAINQKAILRYQMNEAECEALFTDYLLDNKAKFTNSGISTQTYQIKVNNGLLYSEYQTHSEDEIEPIVMMSYRAFLEKLAQKLLVQMATLHRAFHRVKDEIKIEKYLNEATIYTIQKGFNQYLLHQSFSQFQIGYEHIAARIHPTKLTNSQGKPLDEIDASDLGIHHDDTQSPLAEFLFERVFFDSDIEQKNIAEGAVDAITVFSKIPKNSIKIPVAGGGTYSPDFAYIIKTPQGEILNLVVESKDVEGNEQLRATEQKKIQHAEQWFAHLNDQLIIKFSTQFKEDAIQKVIQKALHSLNGTNEINPK